MYIYVQRESHNLASKKDILRVEGPCFMAPYRFFSVLGLESL